MKQEKMPEYVKGKTLLFLSSYTSQRILTAVGSPESNSSYIFPWVLQQRAQ